jgi:hypothetical protein
LATDHRTEIDAAHDGSDASLRVGERAKTATVRRKVSVIARGTNL